MVTIVPSPSVEVISSVPPTPSTMVLHTEQAPGYKQPRMASTAYISCYILRDTTEVQGCDNIDKLYRQYTLMLSMTERASHAFSPVIVLNLDRYDLASVH